MYQNNIDEVFQNHSETIKTIHRINNTFMSTEKKRVCIYPKDIQLITGKSYRQSIRIMQKIKQDINKQPDEFLTIEEFCTSTGLKYEQVAHLIIG